MSELIRVAMRVGFYGAGFEEADAIYPQGFYGADGSVVPGDMPLDVDCVNRATSALWAAGEEPRRFGDRHLFLLEVGLNSWAQLRNDSLFGHSYRSDFPPDAPAMVRGTLGVDALIILRRDVPVRANKNGVEIYTTRVLGQKRHVEIHTS